MMKSPFKRISLKTWIKSINHDFDTIENVYDYYLYQLEKRFKKLGWSRHNAKKDAQESVKNLKKLVKVRF